MPDGLPWFEDRWSRGLLLGLRPDPNSGYRAEVWFEYTRRLFNEIREGSLIAVRNFRDRPENGVEGDSGRSSQYEEYSILQIDTVHPWHYAIQGPGDRGYPAFTTAAAESARQDWLDHDQENKDDVTRIRCEAIPLHLAFSWHAQEGKVPTVFADRSKPMPGFEAKLLRPAMTERIINRRVTAEGSIVIGNHLVQREVSVRVRLTELFSLHFGIFGFTGSGKSNLLSTTVRQSLRPIFASDVRKAYSVVLFDLMDEYTGLLIDQLVELPQARIVICGRETVTNEVMQACVLAAKQGSKADPNIIHRAAAGWADTITLPAALRQYQRYYAEPLAQLMYDKKVKFYEPLVQQGAHFDVDLDRFERDLGPKAVGKDTAQEVGALKNQLKPVIEAAVTSTGPERDRSLQRAMSIIEQWKAEQAAASRQMTSAASKALDRFVDNLRSQVGTRGAMPREVACWPGKVVKALNDPPPTEDGQYPHSLIVVIGETEMAIAGFAREVIRRAFDDRRARSLLHPMTSFVFDEADVFLSTELARDRVRNRDDHEGGSSNVIEEAMLLARRGRKFGLGLGLATQRIIHLNSSVMAQPHTYFISKLPRKSDRERVAEAFAIGDESLEQSFSFTPGQWLIASHDATGLTGTPFPVQLPDANKDVERWLQEYGGRRK